MILLISSNFLKFVWFFYYLTLLTKKLKLVNLSKKIFFTCFFGVIKLYFNVMKN